MAAIKDNHFSSSTHNLHSNTPPTRLFVRLDRYRLYSCPPAREPAFPFGCREFAPSSNQTVDFWDTGVHRQGLERETQGHGLLRPSARSWFCRPAQSSHVIRTPRTHDIARPRTQLYRDFTNDHYSCKRESQSVPFKSGLGWHRGRLQIKAISVMISYRKRNFYVYSLSTANFFKSSKDTLSKAFSFVALRKILCMVRRLY